MQSWGGLPTTPQASISISWADQVLDAWQALVSGPEGDSDDASDAPGTEDVESADTTEPAADAAPDEGESGSVDGDEQPATT